MKIKKGILIKKLGNVYVAYDDSSSTLHEFNEVGYQIIKFLKKGMKKTEIVRRLVNDYKVTENQTSLDFNKFLKDLKNHNLIEGRI